ncbi:zinc finger transcriptional activator [Cladophialophora chaetospira]|uniref:Zinc finger transcriptional activator n=1 Tax=Cladophialophora chaetospira TaxID=386627 RepID=A0AA38WZZ5_9EURO|nr:zinc finger transcriptional activator [Cladophialophora chaetospira]
MPINNNDFQSLWHPLSCGDDITNAEHALQFQLQQQQAALGPVLVGDFASPRLDVNASMRGITPRFAPPSSSGAAVAGQFVESPGYLGVVQLSSQFDPASSRLAMAYHAHQQPATNDLNDTRAYKASSSPEPKGSHGAPDKPHRRGYQACQNCRSRKVKCDLGSVDAPTEPPCKRCLRERLDCRFAATRKKQKRLDGTARDVSTTSDNAETPVNDGSAPRGLFREPQQSPALHATNGFPRQGWSPNMSNNSRASYTSQPRGDPLHSQGSSMYPGASAHKVGSDVHLQSQAAAVTLGGQVSTAQDSLMALVDAAHVFETSAPGDKESPLSDRGVRKGNKISSLGHGGPEEPSGVGLSPAEQAEQEAGMKTWSQMRFVRNGWFTAWEAMQYVAYFYDNLAPMTPVVFPDFKSPVSHHTLLADEPILALAILAIASRHMPLSGNAAVSRSFHIHDKLWTHLRRQVERLLWGQEQFGGGFCGGGNTAKIQETNTGQITWQGSLRTLGTIEALLLLTDWQPRALHFPPGDEENGLLDRSLLVPIEPNSKSAGPTDQRLSTRDYDNLPYASWLEPAWRSDKMSWMILGLAQSLAFELGVFDTNHFNCRHDHGPASECARKRRVRNLVLVYVAQTSGRMGIQSSLNVEEWVTDTIWDMTSRKQEHPTDLMQACWVHIARIMHQANREIFSSHQFTKDLTASGRYKESIATFTPLLEKWKNDFEKMKVHIHPVMQCILLMEYEYARLYINSLGLQKVVESWVEGGATMRRATLLKISEENKPFIVEVTEAALSILDLVIDGIAVQGFLRNAPVRTYLRSLSGMMFTLKRFSLGIHEELVRKCLQRLERTTELLSEQVVDDVHLASSTSRLVQNIVNNVKQTLIRVQISGTGSAGPSREQSLPASPHGHDGTNDPHSQQQPLATHATQPNPNFFGTGPDPLAGIQARSMADLDSQTFVPPPNFGDPDLDFPLPDDVNLGSTMDLAGGDWLALPLDNLWGGDEATVDQGFGGIGPTLGGRDLLEAITNRNYNQMQWNGSQTFGFM